MRITIRMTICGLAVLWVCSGLAAQNLRVDPPGWETPTGGDGSYDPEPFDFGEVSTGESDSVTLRLVSRGPTPLYISSVLLEANPDGAFAITSVGNIPPELLVDEWVDVVLAYSPTGLGDHSATLRIVSNDRETPILDGPLVGTGVPEPATLSMLLVAALGLIRRKSRRQG